MKHNIPWVPMSGVSFSKLGLRILNRLPEDVRSNILYYGGEGSQKYHFDPSSGLWVEDKAFQKLFSDAQALAVLGRHVFLRSLSEAGGPTNLSDPALMKRLEEAEKIIESCSMHTKGILEELKQVLKSRSFDPQESETCFRAGSVSWMMLGDISAEPYREAKAVSVRRELLALPWPRSVWLR